MEDILLLKQYINDLSTKEIVKLWEEYGTAWIANTAYQLLTALLFTDPSFSMKILPKVRKLNNRIKNIISMRINKKKHDEGMC